MIEKGLFPEDIRAYLNSLPIFNHHHGFREGDVSGIADRDIFYHTQPGNPTSALIYDDAPRLNYACPQCDIPKEDCHHTSARRPGVKLGKVPDYHSGNNKDIPLSPFSVKWNKAVNKQKADIGF